MCMSHWIENLDNLLELLKHEILDHARETSVNIAELKGKEE